MKRLIALGLVMGLMFGAVTTAEAGKRKKKPVKTTREAQGTYAAPATIVGNCTQTDGVGCMTIPAGPGEVFLTATATDAHGQPVSIQVSADLDGDAQTETTYGSFCGETTEPIAIDAGASVIFWVGRADVAVLDGCAPGIATQGTLDVVFSNMP